MRGPQAEAHEHGHPGWPPSEQQPEEETEFLPPAPAKQMAGQSHASPTPQARDGASYGGHLQRGPPCEKCEQRTEGEAALLPPVLAQGGDHTVAATLLPGQGRRRDTPAPCKLRQSKGAGGPAGRGKPEAGHAPALNT